jgi:hypothetical protein
MGIATAPAKRVAAERSLGGFFDAPRAWAATVEAAGELVMGQWGRVKGAKPRADKEEPNKRRSRVLQLANRFLGRLLDPLVD